MVRRSCAFGFLLIFLAWFSAGGSEPQRPGNRTAVVDQPVISLWDGGAWNIIKPAALFVAWRDGMIVFRADANGSMKLDSRTRSEIEKYGLWIGFLHPKEITAILDRISSTGFFTPPRDHGISFPDGPIEALSVRHGKLSRRLTHHGTDQWLRDYINSIGPFAQPTREDSQAFADMWDGVRKVLSTVRPERTRIFKGERELLWPEPYTATDVNGDPSVAFWGIPEYKEKRTDAGTPQSTVTMTAVSVVTPDKYRSLRNSPDFEGEERFGDWLYFAVSDIVQVPHDTAFVEVIRRYKVRLPIENSNRGDNQKGRKSQ